MGGHKSKPKKTKDSDKTTNCTESSTCTNSQSTVTMTTTTVKALNSQISNDQEGVVSVNCDVIIGKLKNNPEEDYTKVQYLGEGSFATVFKVKHKLTGSLRAMKMIKKSSTSSADDDIEIMNEITILKKMDHPNILKIFEFYVSKSTYHLVTEICSGGELFNEIVQKGPFNEKFAGYLMYQIFSAINYCHNMNIIHRDLKPENILIERREKNGYLRVKVCDFGTSKIFEKGSVQRKIVGSSYYIAPEVLSKNYDEKCDMWSCGVILYILLSGRPPFGGDKDSEIIERVKTGKYDMSKHPWDKTSSEVKDLIKSLLVMDPTKRISAETALNHSWLVTNQSKDLFNEIKTSGMVERYIENLKNYKSEYILQQTALAYLVHNYPQLEEIENGCKLFNQMDTSGDGKITKDELFNGLAKYVSSEDLNNDVDQIFKNIDGDNNGYIEYEEFVRAAIDKEMFLNENILKFAFRYFDKDNSGEISYEEIEEVFSNGLKSNTNSKEQLKKILSEIDLNGDENISFEEFSIMMRKLME